MIEAVILRRAECYLARQDHILGDLISRYGPCTLGRRRRDPFHVLCSSIIGQQLSAKAADAIQQRVLKLGPPGDAEPRVFTPAHFLNIQQTHLCSAGLSGAKSRWLTKLAEAVSNRDLDFSRIRKMNDADARAELEALPGVGRWTAEMFLIFALDRIDIFAIGDAGLRRSVNRLYNDGQRMEAGATDMIVRRWVPYRSVASWYLWRLVDGDSWIWT